MFAIRIMRLIDNHIDEFTTGQFLMKFCSSEIHITRNYITLFYHELRNNMFSSSSLMSRNYMLVAVIFLNRCFEVIEIFASCISLISQHNASPLAITHRGGATIG